MASTGDATWTAVANEAANNGYGTSAEDIKKYAEVGGAAAGVAVCAATGVGAAAAPLCGIVGGAIGGAIADIGAALFKGASGPKFDDIWNPRLDAILHKLSNAFPKTPWLDLKSRFAAEVNAATAARRVRWSAGDPVGAVLTPGYEKDFVKAATVMGSRMWVYATGPNVGYIDEGTQSFYWANIKDGYTALDSAAFPHDVIVGAANTADALTPRSSSTNAPVVVAGGLAIGTGLWYAFKRGWIKWPFKR